MPWWKLSILWSYYTATWPLRRARNARRAALGRMPVVVIAYHRVADDWATPWTVGSSAFRRQIDWLSRHFDLVSLAEAQRRIQSGALDRPTLSITFDDGYEDNCRVALPLLLDRGIPLTYFVTSDAVLHGRAFPHDVRRGLTIKPNTAAQLRDLAAAGVAIGAHTRTHADLGQVRDERVLRDEVVASRDELQQALGCEIRYFAFPFGQHVHLRPEAFSLARAAGFAGVASAYGGYNYPGDDAFHIQRACVDGPTVRVKNWATIDPYKEWTIPRYQYEQNNTEVDYRAEKSETESRFAEKASRHGSDQALSPGLGRGSNRPVAGHRAFVANDLLPSPVHDAGSTPSH